MLRNLIDDLYAATHPWAAEVAERYERNERQRADAAEQANRQVSGTSLSIDRGTHEELLKAAAGE